MDSERERENEHIVLLGGHLPSDDNRSSTDGRRSEVSFTIFRCRRTPPNILHKNMATNKNSKDLQVLREKVERAIQSLKGGKSQRADIIAELFKDGGEEITKELTTMSKNLDSQAVVIRVDAVTGRIPAEEDKREAMSEL